MLKKQHKSDEGLTLQAEKLSMSTTEEFVAFTIIAREEMKYKTDKPIYLMVALNVFFTAL